MPTCVRRVRKGEPYGSGQAKITAVQCFLRAINERDIGLVRSLVAKAEELLDLVSEAGGRVVRAEDLVTIDQLLAGAKAAREGVLPA